MSVRKKKASCHVLKRAWNLMEAWERPLGRLTSQVVEVGDTFWDWVCLLIRLRLYISRLERSQWTVFKMMFWGPTQV